TYGAPVAPRPRAASPHTGSSRRRGFWRRKDSWPHRGWRSWRRTGSSQRMGWPSARTCCSTRASSHRSRRRRPRMHEPSAFLLAVGGEKQTGRRELPELDDGLLHVRSATILTTSRLHRQSPQHVTVDLLDDFNIHDPTLVHGDDEPTESSRLHTG